MFRLLWLSWALVLVSCRCTAPLTAVEPALLEATPTSLVLPATWVGERMVGVVTVRNLGGAKAVAEVLVAPPFSVDATHLELSRGETAALAVTFAPTVAGHASALLRVGALEVQVEAEALEVPACVASGVCLEAHFDTGAAQCVSASRPDQTACETACVTGGCVGGGCVGRLKGCDDHDACTVDLCDEVSGCGHQALSCPEPTNPCEVARCDAVTGCSAEPVIDGTLCGADDCAATLVDVCIAGQCVQRTRPATGRCANRWVPSSIPGRYLHGMAFDAARKRVVVFGGALGGLGSDTWTWDGTTWSQHTPYASPSARYRHAMAYDAARRRVVLFGGSDDVGALSDTWEWDGRTWAQRTPSRSPPARSSHAMAWDPVRQRVVLVGGRTATAALSDTWEWDGTSWSLRTPAVSPSPRSQHAMAWDGVRQRLVLFGGESGQWPPLSDTWEWDGTTWTERLPVASPPFRSGHAMAWDGNRQRVVLTMGTGRSFFSDLWEWDGTTWTERQPITSPLPRYGHALVWDAERQRVVLFGGGNGFFGDTWEWDGAAWTNRTATGAPPPRSRHVMTWDDVRQTLLLFGGSDLAGAPLSDTWAWDGTWAQRHPVVSPPARSFHQLASDLGRHRVVLFGGTNRTTTFSDTWEWDGTSWAQRNPVTSPPAREAHAMTWDGARQRVVLFGGKVDGTSSPLADTWEWDGTTWTQRMPVTSPPARVGASMTFDPVRQRVVLFGGSPGGRTWFSDTWEWNGSDWAQQAPAPSVRFEGSLAFDLSRSRTVLQTSGATLEWDGSSWSSRNPVTFPPTSTFLALSYDPVRQRVVAFVYPDGTWVLLP